METRITDREQAVNNTFGYINSRTGQFEARNLKEYLTELGLYSEPTDTRAMSDDLKAYYTKLKLIVNNL